MPAIDPACLSSPAAYSQATDSLGSMLTHVGAVEGLPARRANDVRISAGNDGMTKGSAHAPKHIKFVTELPMTGVGKVDKKVLKAGFWVGRERMVG
jgi:non-ribosomal peptide synthetase component E (peptide arylation enzyme)